MDLRSEVKKEQSSVIVKTVLVGPLVVQQRLRWDRIRYVATIRYDITQVPLQNEAKQKLEVLFHFIPVFLVSEESPTSYWKEKPGFVFPSVVVIFIAREWKWKGSVSQQGENSRHVYALITLHGYYYGASDAMLP